MIYTKQLNEKDAAISTAKQMAAAARTAPKGCGEDNLEILIIDGAEQDELVEILRTIGEETGADFFKRDAACVNRSICTVLIGVHAKPLGLEDCGYCGFEDCGCCAAAGGSCAFNITDLGIAVGSAVSIAADNRIDNRVFFSAGKAAIRAGFMSDDVRVCYGIPLSVSGKSIFFDRGIGDVL